MHSAEERDIRIRTEKVKEAYLSYRAKRAIIKWHQRTLTTQKWRGFLDRGRFVKRKIGLESVFYAWKREYLVDRKVVHKTHGFATALLNYSL